MDDYLTIVHVETNVTASLTQREALIMYNILDQLHRDYPSNPVYTELFSKVRKVFTGGSHE